MDRSSRVQIVSACQCHRSTRVLPAVHSSARNHTARPYRVMWEADLHQPRGFSRTWGLVGRLLRVQPEDTLRSREHQKHTTTSGYLVERVETRKLRRGFDFIHERFQITTITVAGATDQEPRAGALDLHPERMHVVAVAPAAIARHNPIFVGDGCHGSLGVPSASRVTATLAHMAISRNLRSA